MASPIDELVSLVEPFATAAGADPVSAVLLLVGGVLLFVSFAIVGWLALGGVLAGARAFVR